VTEAEWLVCTDPQPMLEFLRGKAGGRKLRLFAVACCRRVGRHLAGERNQRAVRPSFTPSFVFDFDSHVPLLTLS
jgi:hypothetical protein